MFPAESCTLSWQRESLFGKLCMCPSAVIPQGREIIVPWAAFHNIEITRDSIYNVYCQFREFHFPPSYPLEATFPGLWSWLDYKLSTNVKIWMGVGLGESAKADRLNWAVWGLDRGRCIKIMDNNKNYRQFISLFTNEGTVVCRAIPEWSFRAERRRCSGQDDKERLPEE